MTPINDAKFHELMLHKLKVIRDTLGLQDIDEVLIRLKDASDKDRLRKMILLWYRKKDISEQRAIELLVKNRCEPNLKEAN